MITIEKDDFTGFKKIQTPIFNLEEFNIFSDIRALRLSQKMRKLDFKMRYDELSLRIKLGHNVDSEIEKLDSKNLNGFDLIYFEGEDGQGAISIRVYSMLFEDCKWPNWSDQWPMIVDGNRISLTSNHISEHPVDLEFKVYDLPVDVFSNIANATEIKYSLRGKSEKIEGSLSGAYIKVFQAFEKLCFGDEKEGLTIFESLELEKNKYKGFLDKFADGDVEKSSEVNNKEETSTYECFNCKANNIVPNNWDSFKCHNCKKDNEITRPKDLSDEERNNHENRVVELIKEKKIEDAIKYYGTNFGFTDDSSKLKVKNLAEKNGLASIITSHNRKKVIIGLMFYTPVFAYLCYLGGLPSHKVNMHEGLWFILILTFGTLTIRSIIKLFKK